MAILSSTGRFAAGESCANNDIFYGPYATIAAAHAALLNAEQNVVGRTVGIQTGNTIEEYWYQGGTEQANLVKKQTEVDTSNLVTEQELAQELSGYVKKTDPPSPASGNIVVFDENGGFGNSGKKVTDFVTKSVNDLANYYLKSETYTKEEVSALIGAIQQFHYEVYTTLPQSGESNVLYLIGPTGTGKDKYEEYVYANGDFVQIGDTSIDLSGYVTTSALNTALAGYTTTESLTTLLAGKQDTINDLSTIRSGAAAGATAVQPASLHSYVQKSVTTGLLKNDGTVDTQTAGKAASALQPKQSGQYTQGNIVVFDANGGLSDSQKKTTDFATTEQGTKADNAIPMPTGTDGQILEKDSTATGGVKWVNKPSDGQDGADGKSAYDLYVDSLPAGTTPLSQDAWLASLKANIGEFLFVPTDSAAVTAMGTIGQTYTSAIDPQDKNVAPTQNTLSVILLMNAGTTPDKTMMIATQEVTPATTPATYEFVYAGDLQSAMPSNVLTEDDIDNDFAGGSDKVAGADEVKELADIVTDIEVSNNILDPRTLQIERDTVTNANGVTVTRYKGIIKYTDGQPALDNGYLSKQFGYTDFIPFGEHNDITINYGGRSSTIYTNFGRRTALLYDSNKNFLEHKTLNSITSEDITVKGGGRFTVVKDSYNGIPYAYVRFNLGDPLGLPYDGYAVYYDLGAKGELPAYQPYSTRRIMRVIDNLDSDDAATPLSARQGKILNNKPAYNISSNATIIIDRENVNFLEQQSTSKNLLNPDKIIEGIGIERKTGKERTPASTVVIVGCTDYVDVLQNTHLVCNKGWNTSTYGWAAYRLATQEEIEDDTITKFYHDGKTLVFAHGGTGGGRPTYTVYSYVNGDLYIRYSLMSLDDVQIEVGYESTSYEPYSEKLIINSVLLPEITPTEPIESKVEVQLPNDIVVCEGDRLQLFWRNCVKIPNPYIYGIFGSCKQSNSDSYVGLSYPRYFQFDAKSSMINNNYILTVSVNNGEKTIGEATTNIRVVAKATTPVSQKNILIVGASTYANTTSIGVVHGYIGNELNRRLTSSTGDGTPSNPTGLGLSNISFIGTVETDNGLMQEVRPGWGWKDFATTGRQSYYFYVDSSVHVHMGDVYSGNGTLRFAVDEVNVEKGYFSAIPSGSGTQPSSGTLTKVSGDGDSDGTITYTQFEQMSRNPFWNNGTSELDFINYAENECGLGSGTKIDYAVCGLGFNDLIAGKRSIDTTIGYIRDFLDALISDFSDVKVIIAPLPLVSPFGGFTKNYGTRQNYSHWNNDLIVWNYNSALLDLIEEYPDNLVIAPSTYLFDSEHLYPSDDYNVCNRNTSVKESLQTNGVHFTQQGAFTVADVIFNTLMGIM